MIRLGELEIHRVPELTAPGSPALFKAWDEAAVRAAAPWYVPDYFDPATGTFPASIHSWLVRGPEFCALIDLGAGDGKDRRGAMAGFGGLKTGWLDRLGALGVQPEDVTHVLFTHLHVDHVGWATVPDGQGGWTLTFPNALHVMTRTERDHRDPAKGAAAMSAERNMPWHDSILPMLEQGRVDLVAGDETGYLPGVDFIPAPGHAKGQMAIRLTGGGASAICTADVMHQPIQVFHPDWASGFCEDKPLAETTRRRILALAAEEEALVLPMHFGGTHAGHVRRAGEGFVWAPLAEPA
ncbi:MAG: MBL fold metallo-hydrolase [Pseudomonadota bacterium]|nr:MBL fold metallo-hydrolase [Pseudomonadota bacterium]